MIRRLERSHDHVIGYSLSDEVTQEEYTQVASELRDDLDRVAIVTDDTATSMVAKVAEALPGIDTETFSGQDEPQAWAWLE